VRKTHLVLLAIVTAAIVLAIGAVSAYASLGSDTTAPTTVTDVAATYWNAVTITATATDDEGIRYVYHELDEGVVRLAPIDDKPLSTQIIIPTRMDDPLAAGTHKLKYWAQDINGNVETQHVVEFTVGSDTDKPVTTVTGATDGAWYKAGMTVHLAAADGESGVKELSFALVGAAATVVAAEGDLAVPATAGAHAIAYHATDVAGNVEAEKTFTVNVDTSKPVTSAAAASVVKGRTAKLKYRVTESGPNSGKTAVVIKVRNHRGKVVKTFKASQVAVNTAVSAKFRCKLAAGVYTYTVYATDTAGNAQSKAGSAKLTVK
jgi:hypothetical protein